MKIYLFFQMLLDLLSPQNSNPTGKYYKSRNKNIHKIGSPIKFIIYAIQVHKVRNTYIYINILSSQTKGSHTSSLILCHYIHFRNLWHLWIWNVFITIYRRTLYIQKHTNWYRNNSKVEETAATARYRFSNQTLTTSS